MLCKELNDLLKEARMNLEHIKKLAFSCIRKIGIDPEEWDGRAYLIRRSNGKAEYASLEIYVDSWRRKVIGLGRLDKFNKEKLYRIMKTRFGCTADEVNALLLYRFLKQQYDKLDTAEYHLRRFYEIIQDLNKDLSIDELVEYISGTREVLVWH